ncbi:uncharacterized protein PHACADRAFT_248597 [Phanerochaete carnosa HHB-10118-sp]|uniref:Carboxypeptidase n=1 Tax=Phanerochaete carnosa (strain HHB-10118-sp) TaxID=650164 RepID=K5XF96_PHACS|nr:uncharacterized protein PHACADRAFT_248597 [Phanerochaete carnosa HHB-10118-sp]EKM61762.1 hypothetical protein PHACADRAFT_248597 [Phanerochaete carnosa HHB-10118-sp]
MDTSIVRGGSMRNSTALLPELVDGGMRLLIYAGNGDIGCNHMGSKVWVSKLPNRLHAESEASEPELWTMLTSRRVAGEVRSAGGGKFGAGKVRFVQIYRAGHMASFDQPEAAVDLFTC